MKRIAVVDDDPDNRLLLRAILEDRYTVAEYRMAVEALQGFRRDRPDVALLDISLPEMSGTELLRLVRADAALFDVPMIALTAHAMAGDRERLLAAGFDDYLTKPIIDETALVAVLERWMTRRACLGGGA